VKAACAAAASAGGFLTRRGQAERLILATGRLRHDRAQDWGHTARAATTLACYMRVAQAGQIVARWPAGAVVEVVSKAQTAEERVQRCRLDGLEALCRQHKGLNPAMLLIRWPLAQADGVILRLGAKVVQAPIGLFSPRVHIGGAGRLAGEICPV
jgi:uroporphyrin-III C-methyltransferase/precorrin-2 dehydrogenase/sirohydrochlorin ferrochelatase